MSRAPRSERRAPSSPFIAPAWITLASLVGLVSALLDDGIYDVVSWVIFSGLIGIAVRAWIRRDRGR